MSADFGNKEETAVVVAFFVEGNTRSAKYLDCYGFVSPQTGQVIVRRYGDAPNLPPRAVYPPQLHPIIEHLGEHKPFLGPQAKPQPPEEDSRSIAQRIVDSLPEPKRKEPVGTLEKHMATFEEMVEPAKPLPPDPKDDAGPSTEADAGSDPNMLETPSGKFLVRIPVDPSQPGLQEYKLPQPIPGKDIAGVMFEIPPVTRPEGVELAKEPSRGTAVAPQVVEPTRILKPSRSSAKKRHARPRQLPGATALIGLALFLSVSFHRNS